MSCKFLPVQTAWPVRAVTIASGFSMIWWNTDRSRQWNMDRLACWLTVFQGYMDSRGIAFLQCLRLQHIFQWHVFLAFLNTHVFMSKSLLPPLRHAPSLPRPTHQQPRMSRWVEAGCSFLCITCGFSTPFCSLLMPCPSPPFPLSNKPKS